jgi:hypothetical protein
MAHRTLLVILTAAFLAVALGCGGSPTSSTGNTARPAGGPKSDKNIKAPPPPPPPP